MYILVPSVSTSVFFWAGRGGEGGGGVSHHGKNKIKFNVKGTKDFLGKDEPQLLFFEEKLAEIVIFRQFGSWTIAKTKRDSEKEFTFLSDTSSQIWLILLVDDCQSTYRTRLKKKPLSQPTKSFDANNNHI